MNAEQRELGALVVGHELVQLRLTSCARLMATGFELMMMTRIGRCESSNALHAR
jgi:hypothetical protein